MSIEERAVAKFKAAPSPVVLTREEYLAFCRVYGVIQPNDYEHPFMGKVIDVRDPEYATIIPPLPVEEGDYSAGISFADSQSVEQDPFIESLIPELEQGSEEAIEPEDAILDEDPDA